MKGPHFQMEYESKGKIQATDVVRLSLLGALGHPMRVSCGSARRPRPVVSMAVARGQWSVWLSREKEPPRRSVEAVLHEVGGHTGGTLCGWWGYVWLILSSSRSQWTVGLWWPELRDTGLTPWHGLEPLGVQRVAASATSPSCMCAGAQPPMWTCPQLHLIHVWLEGTFTCVLTWGSLTLGSHGTLATERHGWHSGLSGEPVTAAVCMPMGVWSPVFGPMCPALPGALMAACAGSLGFRLLASSGAGHCCSQGLI